LTFFSGFFRIYPEHLILPARSSLILAAPCSTDDFLETSVAKSSSGRMPRVRTVTADDIQAAAQQLAAVQGELAAVADRMRHLRLRQLTVTGWGKFDRAADLLREFTAHAEFAVKTAGIRD